MFNLENQIIKTTELVLDILCFRNSTQKELYTTTTTTTTSSSSSLTRSSKSLIKSSTTTSVNNKPLLICFEDWSVDFGQQYLSYCQQKEWDQKLIESCRDPVRFPNRPDIKRSLIDRLTIDQNNHLHQHSIQKWSGLSTAVDQGKKFNNLYINLKKLKLKFNQQLDDNNNNNLINTKNNQFNYNNQQFNLTSNDWINLFKDSINELLSNTNNNNNNNLQTGSSLTTSLTTNQQGDYQNLFHLSSMELKPHQDYFIHFDSIDDLLNNNNQYNNQNNEELKRLEFIQLFQEIWQSFWATLISQGVIVYLSGRSQLIKDSIIQLQLDQQHHQSLNTIYILPFH